MATRSEPRRQGGCVMFSAIGAFVFLAALTPPEAPPDAAILRALPALARGIPLVYEESRDDLVIVKNRAGETKVGPQLFYPMVGPMRLVQTNWECVVYYTHTIRSD